MMEDQWRKKKKKKNRCRSQRFLKRNVLLDSTTQDKFLKECGITSFAKVFHFALDRCVRQNYSVGCRTCRSLRDPPTPPKASRVNNLGDPLSPMPHQ